MKIKGFLLSLLLGIVCAAAISCATTKLVAVWKDEGYQQKPQKIIVMGISNNPATRNTFEDGFVKELKERGIAAVASYTIIHVEELRERELVALKMKKVGADAVLAARPVDKKTVQTYVPGQVYSVPVPYRSWGPYYQAVYSPGYVVEDEYVYLETNLYDLTSEKLVWTARSETLLSGSRRELIDSVIKVIVEELIKGNLI